MKFEIKKSKIKGAGKGTFATEEYWPGEIVGNFEVEYSHTESRFTYFYHDARLEVVNELKYANHSDTPNLVVIGLDLFAVVPIKIGDELTWHYGEDWIDG